MGALDSGAPREQEEEGGGAQTKFSVNGIELDSEDSRKAKVLYDYEALDESELTVNCDQVCVCVLCVCGCVCVCVGL